MRKISIIVVLAACYASFASDALPWVWQSNAGNMVIESIDTIIENEDEHLNFPWMERFDNGVIWLVYHVGTHTVTERSLQLWSFDDGQSWSSPDIKIRCLDTAQLPGPNGAIKSVQNLYTSMVMKNHTVRTYTWATPTTAPTEEDSYCTLPWKSTFMCHRSMVVLDNGDLIATAYARVEGEDKSRAICIKSSDSGESWSFLSTIAYDPEVGSMEGYNETAMEKLADGSLYCIIRTNAFQPARWTKSADNGLTWSKPVEMPGNKQGVDPEVRLLSNGVLMATIGTRPGVDFYLDFSGTGEKWSKIDVPFFEGDGYYCSYTSFVEISPGRVMFLVPQSGFYTNPDWEFDGLNVMKRAYITVKPAIISDLNSDGRVDLEDFAIFGLDWVSYYY